MSGLAGLTIDDRAPEPERRRASRNPYLFAAKLHLALAVVTGIHSAVQVEHNKGSLRTFASAVLSEKNMIKPALSEIASAWAFGSELRWTTSLMPQSPRTFRLPSILLALVSIVESSGVLAQEQAVLPAGDTAAIENVEVSATKANERQLETAAKVFITREELQKFGDKTVSDALKRVPGVTVDQEVRIRGLGSGYTQILVDGNPVPAGFTLDSVSPSAIERIEVYRTALAEFSTRAIAGTINIIRVRLFWATWLCCHGQFIGWYRIVAQAFLAFVEADIPIPIPTHAQGAQTQHCFGPL